MDACMHQLAQQGYVIIPKYVPDDIVERLKRALKFHECPVGWDQLRRNDLLERDEIFCQMLTDTTIKSMVDAYLGEDAKCATWSSNTLFKSLASTAPEYSWHVDYPYHNIAPPWMQDCRPLSVQVMWILDDFTMANGATLIIPGSHLENRLPSPEKIQGRAAVLECPKGSVVISHGAWWHAQGVNTTESPRTCLLGTYVRRWVVSKDDLMGQFMRSPWQTDSLRGSI